MLLAAGMSAVGGKADTSRSCCAAVVTKRWTLSTLVFQSGDPRRETAKAKYPVLHQRRRQVAAGQRSKEAKSDPVPDVGFLLPCCLRIA
jgi:hypothetical protein